MRSAVLSFDAVEDVCERKQTTLVIHPAIRQGLSGYEESLYVGLRCFLVGEGDGIYFLPLSTGGYVRLVFSTRVSPAGYRLVRIDPIAPDGLRRVKESLGQALKNR